MDWTKYYMDQAGGGSNYDYFKGNIYQKGYGLGGTFKRFFKWIVPIFKRHALPVVHSGLKSVGKEVIASASKIANDVVEGRNFKDSANQNVEASINNLKNKFENNLKGNGLKRKRYRVKNTTIQKKFKPNSSIKETQNSKKFIILKKQNKLKDADIFD